VTSQGQRFRRRALRRGYKVDEVDEFLDRVEATLAGDPVDAPVTAQEVHDVVFRVRFGGYDEWQVDLHLDRVERQLAELEERGGVAGRGPEQRGPEQRGPEQWAGQRPEHLPGPEPMGPPMGGVPPLRDDRIPAMPPRPVPPMGAPGGPPMAPPSPRDPGYGHYDEPTFAGFGPGRHGRPDMTAEIRMSEPDRGMPPGPGPMGAPPPGVMPPPSMPPGASHPMPGPVGGAPMGGALMGGAPMGDVQRIDQLRRTFQPRRFGSGYDPGQVNRLFESVLAAMTGRGAPLTEADLDPSQFSLVPGGYFEHEVDAALREVREILRRS